MGGIDTMSGRPEFEGTAKVFWSGRSQAVRLPAACRFDTDEVYVTKKGDQLILRPRGKNWAKYFARKTRASLPQRRDLAAQERTAVK